MTALIVKVLDDIFERSGLSRRYGHPLYAYRLQLSELTMLQRELRLECQVSPKPERSDICAAFCLFAAEWFGRTHEDGP